MGLSARPPPYRPLSRPQSGTRNTATGGGVVAGIGPDQTGTGNHKEVPMTGTTRRTVAAIALSLAGLGLAATTASAGTISASGGTITYKAAGGEANRVTLTQSLLSNGD